MQKVRSSENFQRLLLSIHSIILNHLSKMSADNGIYILQTLRNRQKHEQGWGPKCTPYPVYRVAEASAIDNLQWFEWYQPYNVGAYLLDVWGGSPVFESVEDAHKYAQELETNVPVLEYGISLLSRDYVLYGDC